MIDTYQYYDIFYPTHYNMIWTD